MRHDFSLETFSYTAEIVTANSQWHFHKHHQVIIVTQGLILFEDSEQRSVLCGENAAFIPGGTKHRTLAMGKNIKFYTVYFSTRSFLRTNPGKEYLPENTIVFRISNLFSEILQKICEKPLQKLNEEPYKTALRLLYFLFCQEQRDILPISLPQCSDHKLKQMITYIEQNYQENISLERLEKEFFLSRRTIERRFKKHLSLTFCQYLRLYRIFQATILLNTTDKTVLEIALDVGYSSLSSFYVAFQEIVKESPRKYRMQ